MPSISLHQGLIDHFNITAYSTPKRGGQKIVFIVTIGGKKFALKIINTADERFEREIRICEQFNTNNGIPKIIRVEKYGSDTVILEEYIEGNDLCDVCSQYRNNEPKTIKLIYDIGIILKPVWNARYVHRDLKPQNIRIRPNGDPVVLDFGIARALDEETITVTGSQPLSVFFASPEQYTAQKKLISYRTDFFCLGIIAYYLYTAVLPFGRSKEEIYDTFQKNDFPVTMTSKVLNIFCNSVFKKNPSERPGRIEAFLNLLSQ
jgi:serine/threonine-protein kinase